MKSKRLVIEAVLVSVLLVASVLLGLGRSSSLASPSHADTSALDTTTVMRLTRADNTTSPAVIQATTDVTGTKAAVLAMDILLDHPYYLVDLPTITR